MKADALGLQRNAHRAVVLAQPANKRFMTAGAIGHTGPRKNAGLGLPPIPEVLQFHWPRSGANFSWIFNSTPDGLAASFKARFTPRYVDRETTG